MICYKDKTYCASKVEKHTCGRELSEDDAKYAEETGLPIAYGHFCEEVKGIICENKRPI